MKFIFLALLGFMFSGCAMWPALHRPEVEFKVVDQANLPIENATIKLATVRNPYNRKIAEESYLSDKNGKIQIDSKRNWEFQIYMVPHGVAFYHWEYCVTAPGFAAKAGEIEDSPNRPVKIQLVKSAHSSECPVQSETRASL